MKVVAYTYTCDSRKKKNEGKRKKIKNKIIFLLFIFTIYYNT